MKYSYHEELHRSTQAMACLKESQITICGAGALGANLAESLARCGAKKLRVIDRDRIEEHNLSTQPYEMDEVGAKKADSLARLVYRAVGLEIETVAKELNARNVGKLLAGAQVVVDCFDNSASRKLLTDYCENKSLPCLHVGLADAYAEVIWNETYRIPSARMDDICDYPLARNLVTLAVAIACETIIAYLTEKRAENWSLTLNDLSLLKLKL